MIEDAGTEGASWTPRPMLDSTAVAAIEAVVNGPEDEPLDWDAVELAPRRGGRTAAAAADLRGVAGGGPEARSATCRS